jgi:hypothetical protein
MAEHPYVSRIFVHRTIAEHVRYRDVPVGSGYAYEDWHFNASAVAAGLAYAAAPETVLYYRYRARGMLASMNAGSVRQIPPTPLFDPPTYVRVCRESYYRRRLGDIPAVDPEALRRDFLANRSIRRSNIEANRIDPAIDPTSAIAAPVTSNLSADHALGEAYFEVCRRVGPQHFSDVILATGLEPEGGRDPRIDIVTALAGLDPSVRTLILLQRDASAAITPELPPNSLLIDFAALATQLRPDQVDTVALRLIEATGSAARIHLSADPFARRFWGRYGRLLASTRAIFHRADDVVEAVPGGRIRHGVIFDFLAEHLETFALVVTESDAQSTFDRERIDRSPEKWRRLYRLGPEPQAPTGLSRRVLAIEPASELNRVDLTKVAALASTGSGPIEIEERPALPPSLDGYDVLLVAEVDAVHYGALSRALGAGTAIVGPECPPIREAVGEASGGIVAGTPGRVALDAALAEALRSIFHTDETALAFRSRARDTYASRHLGTAFTRSVKELFS